MDRWPRAEALTVDKKLNLEALAFHWLLTERRCWAVLWERHPTAHYRPDVLGVTRGRLLIEIECKRTLMDFNADQSKTHIACRTAGFPSQAPWKFFYLAPAELATDIKPLLPAWAGLLSAESSGLTVQVMAPVLTVKRLTVRQCVKLTHLLANQIAAMAWNNSQTQYVCNAPASTPDVSPHANRQIVAGHESCTPETDDL